MEPDVLNSLEMVMVKIIEPLMKEPKNETWIIRYRGAQVALGTSRKTSWSTKGHAKTALTNKIKHRIQRRLREISDVYWRDSEKMYYDFIAHLESTGVLEFVKL